MKMFNTHEPNEDHKLNCQLLLQSIITAVKTYEISLIISILVQRICSSTYNCSFLCSYTASQ